MVDVMGHLGMALLWAAPAWLLWEGRVSVAFVGLALSTAMLPDVDLVLRTVLPVAHHGVTHTLVFVAAVALAAGTLAKVRLRSWLERRRWVADRYHVSSAALLVFVTGAFLLGGTSHLFADMLSAPDIAKPVEPFWPLFEKPWSLDLAWYDSPWWNAGLLGLAVSVNLVLGYLNVSVGHPYRIERRT